MTREVPPEKVSRNSKTDPTKWKKGGLARISQQGRAIMCSCGWAYGHDRKKIREDAAERHLTKRHKGRGIWL